MFSARNILRFRIIFLILELNRNFALQNRQMSLRPDMAQRRAVCGWRDWRAPRRSSVERPSVCVSQPVSRVLDGLRASHPQTRRPFHLGRRLPGASSNLPGRPGLDIDPGIPRACARRTPHRPYSVLLPVGFTVPPALPPARCALTAPFHPCRGIVLRNAPRRFVFFCGTFPGLAPAGCLSGTACPWSPDFPPGFHRSGRPAD